MIKSKVNHAFHSLQTGSKGMQNLLELVEIELRKINRFFKIVSAKYRAPLIELGKKNNIAYFTPTDDKVTVYLENDLSLASSNTSKHWSKINKKFEFDKKEHIPTVLEIIKRTYNLIYGRLPEEQKKNEILEIEALIKVKFE